MTASPSSPETLLLVASVLLLVSVIASRTSGRLGVPALLFFVLIGMLAGSEGPGGIAFDDPRIAQALGVLALALILFAGGADTDWREVRRWWAPPSGTAWGARRRGSSTTCGWSTRGSTPS